MTKKQRIIQYAAFFIALVLMVLCYFLWDISAEAASETDSHDFPVYISEILTDNTRYPNEFGQCCDYIELYNSADFAIDLSGFQLGDGSKNKRYRFPSGTIMEPDSYLLVYCDGHAGNSAYAQFGLSKSGGETVLFLTSKGIVIEKVVTLESQANRPMIPGDGGQWMLSEIPTPGAANDSLVPNRLSGQAGTCPVRISEVMTAGTGDPDKSGNFYDWVELHNTSDEPFDLSGYVLSDDMVTAKYTFPTGTVLSGNSYLVITCTDQANGKDFAPFSLSKKGGQTVVLKTPLGSITDIMDTVPVSEGESISFGTDSTWSVTQKITPGFPNTDYGWEAYQAQCTAGSRDIVITEIMASNDASFCCNYGGFCDWIEIRNNTESSIDLAGWTFSDEPKKPDKWTFPEISIGSGEYLVLFCSDAHSETMLHTGFSLSSEGETLVLINPDGALSDLVTYVQTEPDVAICIDPDSGTQTPSLFCTPGYSNDQEGYAAFSNNQIPHGPLAIWEVMTSNDSFLPQAMGKCFDWVEVCNISQEDVLLSQYAITDSQIHPLLNILPEKILAPGELAVIILSGDSGLSTAQYPHADFSLNREDDAIYLYRTDGKLVDYALIRQIPQGSSYGRLSEKGGFFCMEPTPLEENSQENARRWYP